MRKFLFLFLTMLCMLVSQGLNAQTLTITPRDGGYVDPNGDGVSTIIFGCEDGISINKNFSENQYGSEWTFTIQKDGVDYAIADAYFDENEGIPPTYDGDGNIIAYTFGIIPLINSYDYITLDEEGRYTISIPEGLFTLGSGDDATASSAIDYSFTIGTAYPFELSNFTQQDLSIYGTEISVKFGYDDGAVGGLVVNEQNASSLSMTTTDGNQNATITYLVENTNKNLLFKFSDALTAGTYTISIPQGYFDNEYYDMVSAAATITIVIPEGDDLGNIVYKTDFTDWESFDYYSTNKTVETKTEAGNDLSFTFNGFGVYPTGNQTRFSNYTGYMESVKSSDSKWSGETNLYVETSTLSSVDYIVFTEGATGSNRGISISVKCEGEEYWTSLYSTSISVGAGETDTIAVNRTNCQIRFGSVTTTQNAYMTELAIYGTEPATFEITLDPDGTENVEEISEIKVTPAEGYTISSVTTDEDLAITLTATIDDDEVSYTGTATVDETEGTATITFADEEEKAITTEGEYTLTIPAGYFVTEDGATSEEATATYTVVATTDDEEPGPEVEYPTTATWDWQNNSPEGISETNIEGTTGTVASDVEGIELYVDATEGKLAGRYTETNKDAQFNSGTIIQIPVTSTSDVITVTSYPGYHYYTIGGVPATSDTEEYTPTDTDVTAGHVEMVATADSYLYSIVAELQGPDNEGGDEGGSSVELFDEIEEGVYAITKDDTWFAENGYTVNTDQSYYTTYEIGTILFEDDNIKIEVATDQTFVNSSTTGLNGSQLSQIQTAHPDENYTAYVNMGVASGKLDTIDEDSGDPTQYGSAWQGMLKVTPAVDGALTFNAYTTNTRTYGIYNATSEEWITINSSVTGDVATSADLTAGNEYVLVCNGTNNNLYQITFAPVEPLVLDLYTEVEDNTYAITKDASWFAANGFDDWTNDQYSGTIDAGTVVYDGDDIKIETATDTYAGNFGNKCSDMQKDFPSYTGYTVSGSKLDVNFTDEVRIYDPSSIAANNQGVLMVTPYVDGELEFGVYAGDNKRTIGIYELATEEEIAEGTERAWVAINTFKHGGADDTDSTDPTVEKGAPGYVSGSVTAGRQYLLVGGSNKNLTLHQITFVPENEEVTEPEPESEPVSGAITWVLDEGTANQPATYSLGTEDAYLSNSITLGSNLVYTGSTRTVTDGNENNETYDETVTFTTFNNLADEAETEAAESNAIDFAVEMAEGYTFAPTEVSLYATRIGTDLCNLNVTWVDSEGNETLMIATSSDTGNNPGRANGTPNTFTKYTLDLSDYNIETIEDGTFKLRINVFNMAGGKTFGLANIVIKGQVSGVDIDDIYETLCDEIDATDEYLETTWATIKANYPDAITEELESEYKEISDEIEALQAAVDESYEEGSLGEEVLDYETQIASIKAEIDALLETASGINSITIESAGVKGIYTISGQKVAAPTKAGIYIIDGKKVVIK